MLVPTRTLSSAALAALILAAPACDRAGDGATPGEELAEEVEPIDAALLQALPAGTTEETLTRGRELYVVCSVCHGLDGRGTQLGPSLRDTAWIHIDGSIPRIVDVTRSGIEPPRQYPIPMPPMGGGAFDPAELEAVAIYVYALGHSPD